MKKLIIPLCAALILLAACSHVRCAEKPFKILATTFPVYQFTANICDKAKNVELELLIPAAAGCPHDFALKPADLQKLANADAIVINGAGLEEFLTKPLASLHKKPEIIDAGANVPVIGDSKGGHDHINPHIFASPQNAALMATNIAAKLAAMDIQNLPVYNESATAYVNRLNAISKSLQDIGQKAKNRGIALEHDALAYLAQNANLEIVSEFENTASASQLAAIKKELLEKKPSLLAGDSQYPDRLMRALAKETSLPFAQLDACASGPANAPLDYYEKTMEQNRAILEKFFDAK